MSWAQILKKNDKEFETGTSKNDILEEFNNNETDNSLLNTDDLLDIDDEFDHKYFSKIVDLKIEFKEYIDFEALPFFNLNTNIDYSNTFYDFIKNNSENYKKLVIEIENINEEYLK